MKLDDDGVQLYFHHWGPRGRWISMSFRSACSMKPFQESHGYKEISCLKKQKQNKRNKNKTKMKIDKSYVMWINNYL